MRCWKQVVLFISLLGPLTLFAFVPPLEKNNVTLLRNTTEAACQAARNGKADPAEIVNYSNMGQSGGISSPGIRSCTGCALNNKANCVCNKCYYYFND